MERLIICVCVRAHAYTCGIFLIQIQRMGCVTFAPFFPGAIRRHYQERQASLFWDYFLYLLLIIFSALCYKNCSRPKLEILPQNSFFSLNTFRNQISLLLLYDFLKSVNGRLRICSILLSNFPQTCTHFLLLHSTSKKLFYNTRDGCETLVGY